MPAKHVVYLTSPERDRLDRIVHGTYTLPRTATHARILLLTDASGAGPGWTDEKTADALGVGPQTVARTRRRFVVGGLDDALRGIADRPGRPPKVNGTIDAYLVALMGSDPPEGHARWTLRLLADRFVALGLDEGWLDGPVSRETVRRMLKRTGLALRASGDERPDRLDQRLRVR